MSKFNTNISSFLILILCTWFYLNFTQHISFSFDLIEPDLGYIYNTFLKSTFNLLKISLSSTVAEFGGNEFMKKLNEVFSENSIDELFLN